MDTLTEVQAELKYYLALSRHPHLSDMTNIRQLPEANQVALYNLICDLQTAKVHKTVICYQVAEDVIALLDGKGAEFSKGYLNQNEE